MTQVLRRQLSTTENISMLDVGKGMNKRVLTRSSGGSANGGPASRTKLKLKHVFPYACLMSVHLVLIIICLLYTSDAADDWLVV